MPTLRGPLGSQLGTNTPQPASGLAAPPPLWVAPGMAAAAPNIQGAGNTIAAQQAAAVAAAQQAAYQGQQARAVSQWGFNPLAPGGGMLGTPGAGANVAAGPPPLINLNLANSDLGGERWLAQHGTNLGNNLLIPWLRDQAQKTYLNQVSGAKGGLTGKSSDLNLSSDEGIPIGGQGKDGALPDASDATKAALSGVSDSTYKALQGPDAQTQAESQLAEQYRQGLKSGLPPEDRTVNGPDGNPQVQPGATSFAFKQMQGQLGDNAYKAFVNNMASQNIDTQKNYQDVQKQEHPGIIKQLLNALGEGAKNTSIGMPNFNDPGQSIFKKPGESTSDYLARQKAASQDPKNVQINLLGGFGGGLATAGAKAPYSPLSLFRGGDTAPGEVTAQKVIPATETSAPTVGVQGAKFVPENAPVTNTASPGAITVAQTPTSGTTLQRILGADTAGFTQTAVQKAAVPNTVPFQGLNPLNRALGRVRNNLERLGAPGRQLSSLLQSSRDTYETTLAKWVNQIPTVQKLSSKEADNFAATVQKEAAPLNGKVAQAVGEWEKVASQAKIWASQRGLMPGAVENYFPRYFDKGFFKGSQSNKAVDKITEAIQRDNPEISTAEARQQAGDSLTRFRADDNVIRDRKLSSTDYSRTGNVESGYRTDKNVVFDYLKDVAKRGSEVEHFGQGDSAALRLIRNIGNIGGRGAEKDAQRLFDTAVEAVPQKGMKASAVFRSANAITKLGLGAITNAQQSVNTGALLGLRPTGKALGTLATPAAKSFVHETGTTLDSVLKDIRTGSGYSTEVLGRIGAPGFNTVEKFNRSLAAWAGKMHADDLAKSAAKGDQQAIRQLGEFGIDGNSVASRGGQLSREEQIMAGRKAVEQTQFKVDPQDLPAWASSPLGKLVAQFRTFSYNQSALAGRMVNEAIKGNPRPLMTYLAIGTPVGYGTQKLQDAIRYPMQTPPPRSLFDYFTKSGGAGLATDMIQNAQFVAGQKSKDKQLAGILSSLGGPTIGTGAALLDAGINGPKALEKFGLQQVPVVGPSLAHLAFPYGASSSNKVSALNDFLSGYDRSQKQGQTAGNAVNLSDAEKKAAANFFNKNGDQVTNPKTIDSIINGLPKSQQADARSAADKMKLIASQVTYDAGAVSDAAKKQPNEDFATAWQNSQKLANKGADANFSQEVTAFGNFSQQEQENYLRAIRDQTPNAAGMVVPRTLPDGRDRLAVLEDLYQKQHTAESQAGGTPQTDVQRFKLGEEAAKININSQNNANVVDFSGLSDAEQRKFFANNPANAGLSPQADAYQQALINSGLITPYTKANQTYTPGQAIYTGKGQNRLGITPQDLLSGAAKLKAGGSGGSRGGGKRGGRKGGIRTPRAKKPRMASVRKGGGSPPSILGLPRISPGRVRPLDQTIQNVAQLQQAGSPADLMNVLHPQQLLKPVNPLGILFPKKKKARA